MANTSNPGPRFADDAGTRTAIGVIRRHPSFDDVRLRHPHHCVERCRGVAPIDRSGRAFDAVGEFVGDPRHDEGRTGVEEHDVAVRSGVAGQHSLL